MEELKAEYPRLYQRLIQMHQRMGNSPFDMEFRIEVELRKARRMMKKATMELIPNLPKNWWRD